MKLRYWSLAGHLASAFILILCDQLSNGVELKLALKAAILAVILSAFKTEPKKSAGG